MWQEFKLEVARYFETHRNRKIGFVVGFASGAAILTVGFFNTIFALGCGLIGLYVGAKTDGADDLVDKTLEHLDRVLPDKFRR